MWQNGKKITGLWTDNNDKNAYVWVDGLGWRKISILTDAQFQSMLAICIAAYSGNRFVDFFEFGVQGDIYITEIYSW
jgi:hypothetical protein